MKKPATKAEKEFMAKVKSMPCIICQPFYFGIYGGNGLIEGGPWRSEFDHMVDGYRLGHMFGLPLCKLHHEGKKGYGPKEYHWDSSKPNQWKLLEKVYKVLGKEIPEYNPKGRNNFK